MAKVKLWSTNKADIEFSKFVRARDPFCFFRCGNPSSQCSHFWNRYHSATRYDPENGDGICGGCHLRHEGDKQGLYRSLKLKQLGKKRYGALERRARSIMNRSDAIATFQQWRMGFAWPF